MYAIAPPYLKKGDTIAITATASAFAGSLDPALALFKSWGLEVVVGKAAQSKWHSFAGDDNLRAQDLQGFMDDDNVKAIISVRGGYGTVRMIDKVNFTSFVKKPKWIIGFSDVTVLLSTLLTYNVQSIHGPMPITFESSTKESVESLRKALFGENLSYESKPFILNRFGKAEGELIGGNLCLMTSSLGAVSDVDYDGKILVIEDVGEYYYGVDRYLWSLKRAGKLKNLAGLLVGDFTEMKDEDVPFGISVPQMVMTVVKEYNYPVAFNFPIGHGADNHALFIGRRIRMEVNLTKTTVNYVEQKPESCHIF